MFFILFLLLSFIFFGPFLITAAAHLILQAPHEDRNDNLKFGQASCLSYDGRRVVIGANGFDKYKGALYIYDLAAGTGDKVEHWRRSRVCGNDTASAEEKKPRELRAVPRGSGFGFSCAATPSADRVVVGAPGHDTQKGAAYVFKYDEEAGGWEEIGKLDAENGRNGDSFGWAVEVDDACRRVAVSAKGRRANNGEVYMFECEVGCDKCALRGRISPPDFTDVSGPRGIRIRNNFGVSMAMSGEGDVLAVGSTGYEEERGAVYVYKREDGGEWMLLQRLESPNAQKFGFFGFKLAMDRWGKKIVVGADGEDGYKGAAYIFYRGSSKNGSTTYSHFQQLVSKKRAVEDNYGGSIALSADGRALIVGAPGVNRNDGKDHGVMYIYEEVKGRRSSKWELAESIWLPSYHSQDGNFFAWTVALSGNGGRFVATAPDSYGGAGLVTVGEFVVKGKRAVDHESLQQDDVVDLEKQEL